MFLISQPSHYTSVSLRDFSLDKRLILGPYFHNLNPFSSINSCHCPLSAHFSPHSNTGLQLSVKKFAQHTCKQDSDWGVTDWEGNKDVRESIFCICCGHFVILPLRNGGTSCVLFPSRVPVKFKFTLNGTPTKWTHCFFVHLIFYLWYLLQSIY